MNFSRLLVFEPRSLRENFFPLTYTRPASSLFFGTETLLEGIERKIGLRATDVYVPRYLEEYSRELYRDREVNEHVSTKCLVVNSLVSYSGELWKIILRAVNEVSSHDRFYVDGEGTPVFGIMSECDPSSSFLAKNSKRQSSKIKFEQLSSEISNSALIRYPWEMARDNGQKIDEDFAQMKNSDHGTNASKLEIKGKRVSIAETAEVERFVTLDARKGPVIIDEFAEVQSFSHIAGPCYIGRSAKVRSARIREGTSVGAFSKVAGEVDSTIISEYSNKSHEGFLGHSIVGSWVNVGAMTSNSDLKNTYGNISVLIGGKRVDSGEIKVGVYLGDMSKTAVGAILSSGKKIGTASQVFGFVSEDVPSFTMYGKSVGSRSSEVVLDSAITTQKRMMARRGLSMSEALGDLIRSVYKMTKGERAIQRVSKARFKLP